MGPKRVMWVRRYQGQCRALRPLGHQGYRLRSHNKDQPLRSGYTDRPLPTLHQPARKKRKNFAQVAELTAHHESIIRSHVEDGLSIVYPDGSSEKHPEVGRLGGYGVYFGDHRDVAEFLPANEPQTNIRGELLAALSALQGHIPGTKSLICPDCHLVVDGVLGLAQMLPRHNWRNTLGDVAHADLWAQIPELTERHGTEIKWMHVPSRIGMRGNEKADQLADLGRRKSPQPLPDATNTAGDGTAAGWSS